MAGAVALRQGMFYPACPRAPFAEPAKGCGTQRVRWKLAVRHGVVSCASVVMSRKSIHRTTKGPPPAIVFVRLNPDMINPGPFVKTTEIPFLAGGACIVFACAYGGNRFSRKWIQERRVAHPSTGTVAQNAGGTSTPSSATQTSSCSPQGTGTCRPQ